MSGVVYSPVDETASYAKLSDLLAQYRSVSGNATAANQDMFNDIFGPKAQFVTTSTVTVDQLLASYPANAENRNKYARISNYGGYVDRVLRCDYDSGLNLYFWNPTQAEYGRSIPVTSDLTLYALKSPPSVNLTGSVPALTTRGVTIDPANRRPGEIIEIRNGLTSLAGTLNIMGTGIGTVTANLLGGYLRFMFDGSSGSLQLVRLQ